MIRVNWHLTVSGGRLVESQAADAGVCPWCGQPVLAGEPVALVGQALAGSHGNPLDPRRVDLSDAEWICHGCARQHLGQDRQPQKAGA